MSHRRPRTCRHRRGRLRRRWSRSRMRGRNGKGADRPVPQSCADPVPSVAMVRGPEYTRAVGTGEDRPVGLEFRRRCKLPHIAASWPGGLPGAIGCNRPELRQSRAKQEDCRNQDNAGMAGHHLSFSKLLWTQFRIRCREHFPTTGGFRHPCSLPHASARGEPSAPRYSVRSYRLICLGFRASFSPSPR